MVEARYKLWPGLYAAGRVDRLGFSRIPTDTLGVVTWDADVTRSNSAAAGPCIATCC